MDQEQKTKRYISCELIENGFDASLQSINFCCRYVSNGGGFKAIIPEYTGGKIDWDKFFEVKNLYRKQLKNGEMIPECKDCIYLEEKDWSTDNYIATINLNNWAVCNADCIYCDLRYNISHCKNLKQYKVLPIFEDMIKKKILRKGGCITIAGGEPTIIHEFEKLLTLMLNFGLTSIRILTNGTKYSKSIEKGLKTGAANIVISPDSGTRETYKIIKKIDAHKKVWENVKKYAKVQCDPSLVKTKYIIIPGLNDTKHEIDEWFNRNIESGVKAVAVDIELVWYMKNKNNLPESLYETLDYIIQKAAAHNIILEPHDRAVLMIKEKGNTHRIKFHGEVI